MDLFACFMLIPSTSATNSSTLSPTARKIVPYIDIPLQHINDRILKRMVRRVDRAATESILYRLRRGDSESGDPHNVHRGLSRRDGRGVRRARAVRQGLSLRARRRLPLQFRADDFERQARQPFARRSEARLRRDAADGSRSETVAFSLGRRRRSATRWKRSWTARTRSSRITSAAAPAPTPRRSTPRFASKAKNLKPGDFVTVKVTAADGYDLVGRASHRLAALIIGLAATRSLRSGAARLSRERGSASQSGIRCRVK